MTQKSNSNANSFQEENESLKKERNKKSLKDEFGRMATAFECHESSCGGHKQHPEMEEALEFFRSPYDDLKGPYAAAEKDLKALGKQLNFLSA